MKAEDIEKFDDELDAPLPGESVADVKVSPETIENENESFDALMGMTGKRGVM